MATGEPPLKRTKMVTVTIPGMFGYSSHPGLDEVMIKLRMKQFRTIPKGFMTEPQKDTSSNRAMFYLTSENPSRAEHKMLFSLPAMNKLLREHQRERKSVPAEIGKRLELVRSDNFFDIVRPAGVLEQPPPLQYVHAENYDVNLRVHGVTKTLPNYWGDVVSGDFVGWRAGRIKSGDLAHLAIMPHIGFPERTPDRHEIEPMAFPANYLQRSVDWFEGPTMAYRCGDYAHFGRIQQRRGDAPGPSTIAEAMFSEQATTKIYRTAGDLDIALYQHPLLFPIWGSPLPPMTELKKIF